MSNKDTFSARLDRIKSEAEAKGTYRAPPDLTSTAPKPKATERRFGPRQLILPTLSIGILAVGVFALLTELNSDGANPFDLKAAIMRNMSEEKRATLGNDPTIERELQKRNFADPDLARLILSN